MSLKECELKKGQVAAELGQLIILDSLSSEIGGVEMLEASGDRSSPPFTNFDTSGVFSLYLLSCFPACRKEDSHVRIVCSKKSFSGE